MLSAAASNGAGIEGAHFSHGQFPFHEQGDAAVGGGNPGIHVVGAHLAILLCERKGDVIGRIFVLVEFHLVDAVIMDGENLFFFLPEKMLSFTALPGFMAG